MLKASTAKKLYRLSKHRKQSTSTKDLNDSLDSSPQPSLPHNKLHFRTHSCPEVPPISSTSQLPQETTKTTRSFKKNLRKCHSQAQIDSESVKQQSISIENSSSMIKSKQKEIVRKKSKIGQVIVFKPLRVDRGQCQRVKIEQQMRKYDLSEEMKSCQKSSKGIGIKQEILECLLKKFGDNLR